MVARTGARVRADPSLGVAGFTVARGGIWLMLASQLTPLSASPSPVGLAREGGVVPCSGAASWV
eukprot:6688286-Pyramimonas_sp.AAC.1